MWVTKASGEKEKFDPVKIKRTCLRAGASTDLASKISREVERKAYDGISTRDVLRITLSLLKKSKPVIAAKYDLKGAIFRLGPAGFVFEQYVGEIFKEYGYSTKVHSIVRGACVSHEIDVIATKGEDNFMIECKYHNIPGIYTGLKEVLYTYARFLDLQDGFKAGIGREFKQPWLVCNTKFSDDAIQYANCKGMRMIGWNYPKDNSLEQLIETKKLYPITMLRNLDTNSLDKLASSNLVLLFDLLRTSIKELNSVTKIPLKRLREFVESANKIINS